MSQFAKAIINGTISINKTGLKERKSWGGMEYFGLGISVYEPGTETNPKGRFITRCSIKVTDKNLFDKLVSMDGKQAEVIGELKSDNFNQGKKDASGNWLDANFVQFLFVEEVN